MSITISFSLQGGVVLRGKTGQELLRRAKAVVDALAREFGWTYRIARERLDTPQIFEAALVERVHLRAGEGGLLPPAEGVEE